jgi:HSP20 family protein
MVMRYDTFRDLDRVTQQLAGGGRQRPSGMLMDAYRRGERFFLHFDLPGVKADHIELTVEKNVLTVKAERGWEPKEGDEILVAERPEGIFHRQVLLGEGVDTDAVDARYVDGVLTVEIPVSSKAQARRITVERGAAERAVDASSSPR